MSETTWRKYGITLVALTALSLPLGNLAAGLVNVLSAIAGVIAIRRAMRVWRPVDRLPWNAAAVALGLFATGFLVRGIFGDESLIVDWVATFIELGAYAAIVAMTRRFAQTRSHDRDPTNRLDSLIAITSAFTVVWAAIMVPYLTSPNVSAHQRLTETLFVLITFGLGNAIAGLAIGPGARNGSYNLLAMTSAGAVLSEVIISWLLGHHSDATSTALLPAVVGSLCFVSLGACALHPGMVELSAPIDDPVGVMSRRRLALLLGSLTTPGAVLLIVGPEARPMLTVPIVCAWIVICFLVVARKAGLLRAREQAGTITYIISRTAAGLVAATERDQLHNTAATGLRQLFDYAPETRVLLLDGLRMLRYAGAEGSEPELWQRSAEADLSVALAISGHEAVHVFSAEMPDGQVARSALVVPLISRLHRHGTIIVADTSHVLLHRHRDAIVNICADLALALETADIAESVHRERSERRSRSLIDNAADVIAIVDDEFAISFISPAVTRLLGHDEQRLIGSPFRALMHPAYRRDLSLLMTQPEVGREVELIHADGSRRWFELVARDLRDDEEIRGVVITARDMTERKNAALMLERREARFRALVQNAADGIALIGDDDLVSWVSPTLLRILDLDQTQLLGARLIDVVVPEDQVIFSELDQRARRSSGSPVAGEVRLVAANAAIRVVELTLTDQRLDPSVDAIVANVHDVTARKALEKDLHHQSLHDALTGLPNRLLLHDRVNQLLRRRGDHPETALMLLDLDDFQTVNDAVGHSVGDDILRIVASRISALLRDGDTVARLGGDEFAILVDGASSREAVTAIANRIRDEIGAQVSIAGVDMNVSASVGIAFADDCSEATSELMLRNADIALYAAKRNGKSRLAHYDPAMHARIEERLSLKADLEHAVAHGQLQLHYQPIVDLRDGSIRGFEALMRWNHPTRGFIAPDTFIPLAEETSAIVPMGRWLFETAFAQLRTWNQNRTAGARPLCMSVNLSPYQLEDASIETDLRDTLFRHGIDPKLVIVEITESSAIDPLSVRFNRLTRIAAIGVGIAADDFGSGFASYAALSHLPFTGVKIDRSLVILLSSHDGERTTAQVASIIRMAEQAGLSVVAEGIETEEQRDELTTLGCILGQGYLMYRPMPATDATALVTPTHSAT